MKLAQAYELARQVLEVIAPHCQQAQIAGSIRRHKEQVGDIEIVAEPLPLKMPTTLGLGDDPVVDDLDWFLRCTEKQGEVTRHISADPRQVCWGPRHKKFLLASGDGSGWQPIMVDLYVIKPPAQWGAIYALRTGPSDFNHAIMSKVLPIRNLQHKDGRLLTPDGIPLPTPTERDYFHALGLPYIRPDQRTANMVSRCIAAGLVKPYEHVGPTMPVQAALF